MSKLTTTLRCLETAEKMATLYTLFAAQTKDRLYHRRKLDWRRRADGLRARLAGLRRG